MSKELKENMMMNQQIGIAVKTNKTKKGNWKEPSGNSGAEILFYMKSLADFSWKKQQSGNQKTDY